MSHTARSRSIRHDERFMKKQICLEENIGNLLDNGYGQSRTLHSIIHFGTTYASWKSYQAVLDRANEKFQWQQTLGLRNFSTKRNCHSSFHFPPASSTLRTRAIYFVSLSNHPFRRSFTQTLFNTLDKGSRFTVNMYIRREGSNKTSFPVRSRHGYPSREAKHTHRTIFHGHSPTIDCECITELITN